jgi:sugar/nucleoside kinase (ribokinase family)
VRVSNTHEAEGNGANGAKGDSRYRVRVLAGSLELDFPGRVVEAPTAPAQVGTLILMALHPRRELGLDAFKSQLYDCDPALVSNGAIQTPIARLRQAGLPIPRRRYLLDIAPVEVDIVDVDTRARQFIEQAVHRERLSDADIEALVATGLELHHLWAHDPAAAVGNHGHLSTLFDPYRRRHRRFGMTLVRLLARTGDMARAYDMLEQYVESYGGDDDWDRLERELHDSANGPSPVLPALPVLLGMRVERHGGNGTLDLRVAPAATVAAGTARGAAFGEICERLAASATKPFAHFAISAHNLDRIYHVDRVAVDHETGIDTPVKAAGGSGANTAFALGRLGLRVGVAGIVADDRDGMVLRQSLAHEQVDTSHLLVVPPDAVSRTGHTIIFSDRRGRRSIYVHAGVNEQLARAVGGRPGGAEQLVVSGAEARVVHFSSFTGHAERVLQEAILAHLPDDVVVSFDPGALYSPLGLDRLSPFVLRCDVLHVYERQLREMIANSSAEPVAHAPEHSFRADLESLFQWRAARGDRRPLMVLLKRHRNPSVRSESRAQGLDFVTLAVGRSSVEDLVSTQARGSLVAGVQDSTGAGDAMAAGVHFGLLNGASPAECADLAFLMAMECTSEVGTRSGLPRRPALAPAWARYFPGAAVPSWLRPVR